MARIIDENTLGRIRDMAISHMSGIGKGHGPDHLERVEAMALRFAGPDADASLVSLFALLHDTDDHKFFQTTGKDLPNASRMMKRAGVPDRIAVQVRRELQRFGYSKRLAGEAPYMPEARAVSDADMCDIMGATGIARLTEYASAFGHPFFDPDDRPDTDITAETYGRKTHESPCRHMFEKVLRLPGLMLTEAGRIEAERRFETDVMFLRALFRERNADGWLDRLEQFLAEKAAADAPKKPVHTCVGVYPNMDYELNYVADEDLSLNIEYNRTMRPGRYYFVDGSYACGGIDDGADTIARFADFVRGLGIPDGREPSRPYR